MKLERDGVVKDILNPNEIADYVRIGFKEVKVKENKDDKARSEIKQ